MDKFRILGGRPLSGEIIIGGDSGGRGGDGRLV